MTEVCRAAALTMEAHGLGNRTEQLRNVADQLAAAPPPPAEQASGELPELPKYQHSVWVMLRDENREMPAAKMYFTAEQMRAYARANVDRALAESRAEVARLRGVVVRYEQKLDGSLARADLLEEALREASDVLRHTWLDHESANTADAALEQEPQE